LGFSVVFNVQSLIGTEVVFVCIRRGVVSAPTDCTG
jgi:hypothetical protein